MAKKVKLKKLHPWRKCPKGQHWRSSSNVSGYTTSKGKTVRPFYRKGSCVKNPSRKDQIYQEELSKIAEKYFFKFESLSNVGLSKYPQSKKFDQLIQGWTKYWNDIFYVKYNGDYSLSNILIY